MIEEILTLLFCIGFATIMFYMVIQVDIIGQCKTHSNPKQCYKDNAPFPLNVNTSDWHIWRVK